MKVRRKQRHTATRIYYRLKEEYIEELDVSYRTAAYYAVAKKKELHSTNEEYLSLEHAPGKAQADFEEADFVENGIK